MSRPLRVVLCLPAYVPAVDYGGPISTVRSLGHGLAARGHTVEVWAADFGYGRTRVPSGMSVLDGLRVRYLRRITAYRWSPIVPQARRAAMRSGADVVHVFGLRELLGPLVASGATARGTPYVVEPEGMTVPILRSLRAKRLFDNVIGSAMLRKASGLVATSPLEASELRRVVPEARVWTRPNPVQVDPPGGGHPDLRSRLGVADDVLLAGYLGRLTSKKGLDLLLDAIAELEDVHLVVAGPDSNDGGWAVVRKRIDSAALRDRVTVVGPRWGSERDDLLAALDVFCLPSRSENFGNAAAEAAALGTPVLITNACGVAETISRLNLGIVTEPDAPALAAGLVRFRDERRLRRRSTTGALRIREELSIERVAQLQEDIYLEALCR